MYFLISLNTGFRGRTRTMTDSAATEMGTLIQKHHYMTNERYKEQSWDSIYERTRQPTFWASAPPTIGPIA